MMDNLWLASALWIGLALASALISIRLLLLIVRQEPLIPESNSFADRAPTPARKTPQ
jgi:hypothetical protein